MKSPHSSCSAIGIAAVAAILGLISPASAVVFRWDNPASGFWNDPVNWENDTLLTNDDAQINNGGTALIDDTQGVITGFATMGGGNGNGRIFMTGGTMRTNFDIRVGGSAAATGGTGAFDQSGGDIFMNGGNFNVGFGLTAVGTYNISGGTLLENSGAIFAVGNRGIGTVNQTGGTVYVRGGVAPGTSVVQLGRNAVANGNGFGSGTYNLSGGALTTAFIRYGQVVSGVGVIDNNTFSLSGNGRLITSTIEIFNTAATNTFNFTGGTLTANSVGIPVTNDGGTLSPGTADFLANAVNINSVPFNPIGTTMFTGANSYNQSASGTLAIDIDFGSNDFVDIGAGIEVVNASIEGQITVNLLNGFDPSVGSTFDILSADTITNTAAVIGHTASCNFFRADIVAGGDGRRVLRLTVVGPPATYEEWQAIYQTGLFTDDDDADGLSNGVEYMLGLVPKDVNGANGTAPVLSFTGAGPTKRLRLDFPVADPAAGDTTLEVQASNDLGAADPWVTIASKVGMGPWTGLATVSVGAADDCKVPVTVDDTVFVNTTSQRFLRLRSAKP